MGEVGFDRLTSETHNFQANRTLVNYAPKHGERWEKIMAANHHTHPKDPVKKFISVSVSLSRLVISLWSVKSIIISINPRLNCYLHHYFCPLFIQPYLPLYRTGIRRACYWQERGVSLRVSCVTGGRDWTRVFRWNYLKGFLFLMDKGLNSEKFRKSN